MTMIKTGTVKRPANKSYPDKFNAGQYKQFIALIMDDGTEETIWFTTGRKPHVDLREGDRASILYENRYDGKQIRKLVVDQTNKPLPTNVQHSPESVVPNNGSFKTPTSIPTKNFMDMVNEYVKVFGVVGQVFKANGYPDLSEESIRTITTSLLIQADRNRIPIDVEPMEKLDSYDESILPETNNDEDEDF